MNSVTELEVTWNKSQRIPIAELLQVFPEAPSIIERNIGLFSGKKFKLLKLMYLQVEGIKSKSPPEKHWLLIALYKNTSNIPREVAKLNRYLRKLRFYKKVHLDLLGNGNQEVLDVELARNVPIELIVTPYLPKFRKIRNKIIANCPFHPDKTPSFYLFMDQNSYHCFGCQEHGDVINFIIKAENFTFKEAVRYLGNYI